MELQQLVTINISGNFSCLYAEFHLQRLSGYYVIQTYVPSVLIVILSWVSFWIDHRAIPARISLGLLTVLSITTMSSGALSQLPRVSYVKALDVWLATCLTFVFCGLIEFAIANYIARVEMDRQNKLNMAKDDDDAYHLKVGINGIICTSFFPRDKIECSCRLNVHSFIFTLVFTIIIIEKTVIIKRYRLLLFYGLGYSRGGCT
jgi:C4-dicarboxylate transporter